MQIRIKESKNVIINIRSRKNDETVTRKRFRCKKLLDRKIRTQIMTSVDKDESPCQQQ